MYLDNELTHTFIINEMMIRTLERDMMHMQDLKSAIPLSNLYDKHVRQLRHKAVELKNEMATKGILFQSEYRIDDKVTGFSFILNGAAHEKRYFNVALRNHTLKEIERIFGI